MKNPTPEYARGVCSLHGLIIIEKGISLTSLTMMTKGFPDSFVSDHVLAQACYAACVFGELNNCQSARSELGLVSPEPKPTFNEDALQVIPPQFDEEHGWAARCLYPGMHEFASAFIDAFENSGATNFLSLDFWSKSNERFQVVIQKVGNLTPTDRWKAAEAEVARLTKALNQAIEVGNIRTTFEGKAIWVDQGYGRVEKYPELYRWIKEKQGGGV